MLSYIFLLLPTLAAAGIEYCYNNAKCGPKAWNGLCNSDEARAQSPINIRLDKIYAESNTLEDVHLGRDYDIPQDFVLTNNGNTVQLVAKTSPEQKVRGTFIGDESYIFAQLHFHWGATDDQGSEHKINGKSYALEAHFVHYNSRYSSLEDAVESDESSALAVLGVLFEAADIDNPAFDPITETLSSIRFPPAETLLENIKLSSFLPAHYQGSENGELYPAIQYEGSLTTPTCQEIVYWTVLTNPNYISTSQLNQFRNLFDIHDRPLVNNYRPTLPVYSRKIRSIPASYYRTS